MSEAIQVSVDDDGRIVIPAALRDRLRLWPGMTLIVEPAEDGSVRLQSPMPTPLACEGGVLVAQCEPLEDLTDIVARHREERIREFWPES